MMGSLKKTSWSNIRPQVAAACHKQSALFDAFDALEEFFRNDERKQQLWLAEYSYGELIVDAGHMKAPSGTATDIIEKFNREDECGNPVELPVGIVLSESVEVFMPQTGS